MSSLISSGKKDFLSNIVSILYIVSVYLVVIYVSVMTLGANMFISQSQEAVGADHSINGIIAVMDQLAGKEDRINTEIRLAENRIRFLYDEQKRLESILLRSGITGAGTGNPPAGASPASDAASATATPPPSSGQNATDSARPAPETGGAGSSSLTGGTSSGPVHPALHLSAEQTRVITSRIQDTKDQIDKIQENLTSFLKDKKEEKKKILAENGIDDKYSAFMSQMSAMMSSLSGTGIRYFISLPMPFLTLVLALAMGMLGSVIHISRFYFRRERNLGVIRDARKLALRAPEAALAGAANSTVAHPAPASSTGSSALAEDPRLARSSVFTWYVFRLFEGMTTALVVYIALRAGQVSLSDAGNSGSSLNPFVVAFASVLAGLLSEAAYSWLVAKGSALFQVDDQDSQRPSQTTAPMPQPAAPSSSTASVPDGKQN